MTAAAPTTREYRPRWSWTWARLTLRAGLATSPCAALAMLCIAVDFEAADQDPARYGALDVLVITGCLVVAAAFAVGGCAGRWRRAAC